MALMLAGLLAIYGLLHSRRRSARRVERLRLLGSPGIGLGAVRVTWCAWPLNRALMLTALGHGQS